LIDIIAHITKRNVIHHCIELLIIPTIHIGQLTWEIASSLSFGVSGFRVFLNNIHNHLNVNNV
jgi:hypothetical protein